MKLVQKQWLRGSRSFEIEGDTLTVHVRTPLRSEKHSVVLAVVNPEPVVNEPFLDFHSRVRPEPLFSLLLHKPDRQRFDDFVALLQRRIREEYGAFTGLRSGSQAAQLNGNSWEEPPDFDAPRKSRTPGKAISVDGIDGSLRMLRQHLDGDDLDGLVGALEALREAPRDEARFADLVDAFEQLGPRQGAVLTYAPYVSVLLSDDPFEK